MLPLLIAMAIEVPAGQPAGTRMERMTALYEDVCLRAFPDDAAVDAAIVGKGAKPLSASDVRITLRDDAGRGWELADGDKRIFVFLELPPFHACSVRWEMAPGDIDRTAYHSAVERYLAGGTMPEQLPDYDRDAGDIHVHASGMSRRLPDGGAESLMVFEQQPRDPGQLAGDSVDFRFVHQIFKPPR